MGVYGLFSIPNEIRRAQKTAFGREGTLLQVLLKTTVSRNRLS